MLVYTTTNFFGAPYFYFFFHIYCQPISADQGITSLLQTPDLKKQHEVTVYSCFLPVNHLHPISRHQNVSGFLMNFPNRGCKTMNTNKNS